MGKVKNLTIDDNALDIDTIVDFTSEPSYDLYIDPGLQSTDTITVTSPIDIGSLTTSTIDLDSITYDTASSYSITIDEPVALENSMPSIHKIQDMCKHYPALNTAWEKFKTIYKMVEQDYKGNFEDDDDIPF